MLVAALHSAPETFKSIVSGMARGARCTVHSQGRRAALLDRTSPLTHRCTALGGSAAAAAGPVTSLSLPTDQLLVRV